MVDLIKSILKWIIIVVIIFLLIFIISKVINGDTKKKTTAPSVQTVNNNDYEPGVNDNEPDVTNDNNPTVDEPIVDNAPSVVDTPDTATKEEVSMWIGFIILISGSYYIYSRKKAFNA